eukprot:TRINITY_DN2153_c3_g3_i1.p1 TRINITY_DN2153_c3_g3~~TRINITY_DN2153_c3_g3_i1.p1  ORF type:complete len:886 (-),score=115.28 TRINITY_DN2153_c3_g3_i1:2-2659(-)
MGNKNSAVNGTASRSLWPHRQKLNKRTQTPPPPPQHLYLATMYNNLSWDENDDVVQGVISELFECVNNIGGSRGGSNEEEVQQHTGDALARTFSLRWVSRRDEEEAGEERACPLPPDLWMVILSFLTVGDLWRISGTCKRLHDFALGVSIRRWHCLDLRHHYAQHSHSAAVASAVAYATDDDDPADDATSGSSSPTSPTLSTSPPPPSPQHHTRNNGFSSITSSGLARVALLLQQNSEGEALSTHLGACKTGAALTAIARCPHFIGLHTLFLDAQFIHKQHSGPGFVLALEQHGSTLEVLKLSLPADAEYLSNCITDDVVRAISAHCTRLRSLTLEGCSHVTNETAVSLIKRCGETPSIEKLSLKYAPRWTNDVITVFVNTPLFTHTAGELRTFKLTFTQITDAGLKLLASSSAKSLIPSLHTLDLAGSQRLTDTGLEEILHFTALRSLCLSKCDRITGATFQNERLLHLQRRRLRLARKKSERRRTFSDAEFPTSSPDLESSREAGSLRLSVRIPASQSPIEFDIDDPTSTSTSTSTATPHTTHTTTHNTQQHTCALLPYLESVKLYVNTEIGPHLLPALLRGASSMHSLCIDNPRAVSEDAMRTLAEDCADLRTLKLKGCNLLLLGAKAANEAFLHFRELEVVKLDIATTDAMIHNLAVTANTKLRVLELWNCSELTDNALCSLATHCGESLATLRLRMAPQISDIGVSALSEDCRRLKELSLSKCSGLTSDGLVAVATGCTALRNLCLRRIPNIDSWNTVLRRIANNCHMLSGLALSHCPNLSDSALIGLLRSPISPQLRCLMLADCPQLTDNSLALLGHYSTNLEALSIRYMDTPTDITLRSLHRGCQATLRFLDVGCCRMNVALLFKWIHEGDIQIRWDT